MKTLRIALMLCGAVALSACDPSTGTLTPTAQSKVQQALNTYCPVLAVLAGQPLTTNENLAYNTLAIACPPNAPPTNAVTVALDLATAYGVLSPLLKHK